MTTRNMVLLLALLFQTHSPAATWYAAPSAGSAGDGSVTNPWPLQVALNKTANIKPGDTLYLRGGTYHGAGFLSTLSGTSNNYVTVRSFPGEWAVIADGAPLSLAEDIGANTDHARVSGGEFLIPAMTVMIGNETIQIGGNSTPTNTILNRGWDGTTKTNHPAGSKPVTTGSLISHSGSYVSFHDFEMTCARATNRIVNGSSGNYVMSGLDLLASGHGNKAVNLIIHNVGHPGIGFWQQGEGGEINGCLIWGVGFYDNNGAWIRGSGIYSQNAMGLAKIKNIITFRNFTYGAKVFGETGPVKDFQFLNNIAFANPEQQLEASSGSTATSNTVFNGNIMLGSPLLSYVSLSNTMQLFANNVMVNGSFVVKETWNSVYTNNLVFMTAGLSGEGVVPVQYQSTRFSKNLLNLDWNRNTYYIGAGTRSRQWGYRTSDIISSGNDRSGNLTFAGDVTNSWQAWSGLDADSTCKTNWPTDYLKVSVQSLDYDTNRWHICVVNTTTATEAALDLAPLGFDNKQVWQLRDAQDYFIVLGTGMYAGSGTINLPLNRTNVAMIYGSLTHYKNEHSNVKNPKLFNAFVLERIPRPKAPKGVGLVP